MFSFGCGGCACLHEEDLDWQCYGRCSGSQAFESANVASVHSWLTHSRATTCFLSRRQWGDKVDAAWQHRGCDTRGANTRSSLCKALLRLVATDIIADLRNLWDNEPQSYQTQSLSLLNFQKRPALRLKAEHDSELTLGCSVWFKAAKSSINVPSRLQKLGFVVYNNLLIIFFQYTGAKREYLRDSSSP